MKKIAKLAAVLACVAILAGLAGCAGRGTLSSDIDDATGAYTVTADDAGKGSGVGSLGGGIEVAKDQVLVISPDLQKGSLQVRVLDGDGEVALDVEASGTALSSHELSPGDYSIGVSCNEDGTTGTVLVVAVDADELEKQNQDIDALLTKAGD